MSKWPYTIADPCTECYGWDATISSTCSHLKYTCPECGRMQCLEQWRYPMKTKEAAVHFLKAAEEETGKDCFVRDIRTGPFIQWKIFTSESDYDRFMSTAIK